MTTESDSPAPARWGWIDRLGVALVGILIVVFGVVAVSQAGKGPTALELAAWHEAGHAVVGELIPDECGLQVERLHVVREGSGAVNFSRTISRVDSTGECQWADLLMVVAGEEAGALYGDLQASPEQAASDRASALHLLELLRVSRPVILVDGAPVDWDAGNPAINAAARTQARQLLDQNRDAVERLAVAVLAEPSLNLGRQRIADLIQGP